jgi:hypothetical protein
MFIDVLPTWAASNLGVIGLLVVGILVEKQYVSRPAVFASTVALNGFVYNQTVPSDLLVWYANIGAVVGTIAAISYYKETSLSDDFYDLAWYLYSSKAVGLTLLLVIGNVI